MREGDDATLDDIRLGGRGTNIEHHHRLHRLIDHGTYRAKYLNLIEGRSEACGGHRTLEERELVVMDSDEENIDLLHRVRRLRRCGCGLRGSRRLVVSARDDKPVELDFAHGHGDILARLELDDGLLFLRVLSIREFNQNQKRPGKGDGDAAGSGRYLRFAQKVLERLGYLLGREGSRLPPRATG